MSQRSTSAEPTAAMCITTAPNLATSNNISNGCERGPVLKKPTVSVTEWSVDDVLVWAKGCLSANVLYCLRYEGIDGQVLLELSEEDIRDFRYRLNYSLQFSELKKWWLAVRALQQPYAKTAPPSLSSSPAPPLSPPPISYAVSVGQQLDASPIHRISGRTSFGTCHCTRILEGPCPPGSSGDCDEYSPPMSLDGRATRIPPEFFKTFMSVGYSFLVTWITSFVMVIVHERVPDMKRYPPLPDIFLDNVPHIPWAFHMCEITGTLLFSIWFCVCLFHKYRMVLLRRFFALAGTVFLLRCVTMLITSLSVPGTHLQCNQNDYAVDDTDLTFFESLEQRIQRAYIIWSGLGMSIQGVRTCGDYMFSGHTVALTLLNFFITEYTPRNLYFLHTLTWLLNMFGIFFILAAHEHYSIDVFVAFYITSRLFLYYHTLANNQSRPKALMSHDSNRTRVWFPMFSYFESSVDGIIPNEFDTPGTLVEKIWCSMMSCKDCCLHSAQRFWIEHPQLAITSKNLLSIRALFSPSKRCTVGTSTHSSVCNTPTTSSHTSYTSLGASADLDAFRSDDNVSNDFASNRVSSSSVSQTTLTSGCTHMKNL